MNVLTRISNAVKVLFGKPMTLTAYDRKDVHYVRVKDIINIVSEIKGVPVIDIISNRRQHKITGARHLAMAAALRFTRANYSDIGRVFNKDHSTVYNAEAKYQRADMYMMSDLNTVKKRLDEIAQYAA
jgi:chromosomal replication initiation ATPase DnaA